MSAFFPNAPLFPAASMDARPVYAWVVPALIPERDYARTRRALPSGMPDCLEVHVLRSADGIERSTAAVYGNRAYLIHYEYTPDRDG